MEHSPSSPLSPAECARANERLILTTIANAYGVPINAISLLADDSYASVLGDGSVTFPVLHWDGRMFAVNAFVKPDDSLANITYGQV